MLHLLQCDAVRADYNCTTVYIINRINSSYAFLLKFLHNLGIVYNGPKCVYMLLAIAGTFLCHIYGPLYTETKTCIFSNKYFHKNNRCKMNQKLEIRKEKKLFSNSSFLISLFVFNL